MPYNNAVLPPREEPTGTTQLPLSRVKKMIAIDNDINMCSSGATFMITLAAEMFIQYLAEQGHNVVKSERKPRRNIQYRDLAAAVSRHDNLEFLSDLIPKTIPFSTIKANKAAKASTPKAATNGDGVASSSTHSHPQSIVNGINGFAVRPGSKSGDVGAGNGLGPGIEGILSADTTTQEDEDVDEGPEKQLERESKRRLSAESADDTVSGGEDTKMRY